MPENEDSETVEAQKLTPRDVREIQEGACLNCAVASLVILLLGLVALLL